MWILDALYSALWPPTSPVVSDPRVQDVALEEGSSIHANEQNRVLWKNGLSVSKRDGDLVVAKMNDFFEQGKREISKAVRAEEWGMPEEAVKHYKNASKILSQGLSTPPASLPSSSQAQDIKTYEEKMLKWYSDVEERLQVLDRRIAHQSASTSQSVSGFAAALPYTRQSSRAKKPVLSAPRMESRHPSRQAMVPTARAREPGQVKLQSVEIKGVDPKYVQMVEKDIVDRSPAVQWLDIAGLAKAKQALQEMVILPSLRKDLFQGLRKPARGLLLFGPPGNGKTMLAKAVASECDATFFSISASSLTSKWVGEGEKMVRALFAVAAARQPSVIFIDEIDSIMSSRSSNEHEASLRLKTEFLVQFDGVLSNADDHVTIMAATNRPKELDDAVRRRLVKRIYVPLPDSEAREWLFNHLLSQAGYLRVTGRDLKSLVRDTDGYSGSDIRALCQEAAMIPIRELGPKISTVRADQVRPLSYADLQQAMKAIRRSVSKEQLAHFDEWNDQFGSS